MLEGVGCRQGPSGTPTSAVVWRYLTVETDAVASDVIFAFGSRNLGVARTSARLHHARVAPWILVTGGAVCLGEPSEADVYATLLQDAGVDPECVIVERHASNTGENVALGMAAIAARGIEVTRATLVAFPTSLRRCRATFTRQFPAVATSTVPAFPTLDLFEATPSVARRTILAELDRLVTYPELGFFDPEPLPPEVEAAAGRLRALDPARVSASA